MPQDCTKHTRGCIKGNSFTTETIHISDMKNFAVCLQIDQECYELGLSGRSVDLK